MRGPLAAALLAFLLLPDMLLGVRALVAPPATPCACTPHVCHCPHGHQGDKRPHCHFPGGQPERGKTESGGPTVGLCKTDAPAGTTGQPYLLPAPEPSSMSAVEEPLRLAEAPKNSLFSFKPQTPPPRSSR